MTQTRFRKSKVAKYYGPFGCDKLEIKDGEISRCKAETVLMVRNPDENKRYCEKHARNVWLKMAGIKQE